MYARNLLAAFSSLSSYLFDLCFIIVHRHLCIFVLSLNPLSSPLIRREVEGDPDSGFETTGCTEAQLNELNGNKLCGALSDPAGPFADCNAQIPPDVFQE